MHQNRVEQDAVTNSVVGTAGPKAEYHKGWTLGLVMAGILATVISFFAKDWVGLWGIDWIGVEADEVPVVQSIFTNLGTGFISAAALLRLEPYLKRVVKKEARQEARSVADEATSGIADRVQALQDELERIHQKAEQGIKSQDEAVAAIDEDLSYGAVLNLMSEALDAGAILDGQISIQATPNLGEFVVTVACHEPPINRIDLQPEEQQRRLRLRAQTPEGEAVETWHAGEPFSDVAHRLHVALSRKGAWGLSKSVPWFSAWNELKKGLSLALRSRRRDEGATHLQGRLGEVLVEGWYITDAGLECPDHKLHLASTEFPFLGRRATQGSAVGGDAGGQGEKHPRPQGAPEEVWNYALHRCRARFTHEMTVTGHLLDLVAVPRENLGKEMP